MEVKPADTLNIPPGTDAVEYFYDNGFTDGMPVVIPTRGRVAQMLLGTDRDPLECIGRMPPSFNPVSVEHVAIASVMAGCSPAMFRVVLAGAEAFLERDYQLTGSLS